MAWTLKASGPILVFSEEVTGTSNKTLPSSVFPTYVNEIEVQTIRVELVTTATVGNRVLRVQVLDEVDSDVLLDYLEGTSIVASTSNSFEIQPGLTVAPTVTAGTNRWFNTPKIQLCTGMSLKIFDNANIGSSVDDLIIHVKALSI